MPLWLTPALDAWVDLGGLAPWWRIKEWAEYYDIDLEWLLPVMREAAHLLNEHTAKLTKDKRAGTPRNRPRPRH